jgi:hypothetical protein
MAFKLDSVKAVNLFPAPYREESSFTFDKDIFNNCEDNINLYGYFQSEKYFKHIEQEIRDDFVWRDDVWNTCKEIFDQITTDGQAISCNRIPRLPPRLPCRQGHRNSNNGGEAGATACLSRARGLVPNFSGFAKSLRRDG